MVDFPLGSQWELSVEDVHGVLAEYGLKPRSVESLRLGGVVNGNALVSTNRGKVVVRVHRPWTTPERLECVHGIMASLGASGLPVPEVLRTPRGGSWSRLGDRMVEINRYIPHDSHADTWEWMGVAFEMMARLHAELARIDTQHFVQPLVSSYAAPSELLTWLADTESVFEAREDDPRYPQVEHIRSRTRELLRELDAEYAEYADLLPRALIHSDYGFGNLLTRDDIVGILDFDFMGVWPRVHDPAYSLYWSLIRLGDIESGLPRAAELLERYNTRAASPLAEAEVRALPFEIARAPLHWIPSAGYTEDPMADTLSSADSLEHSVWLIEHARRVRIALTSR